MKPIRHDEMPSTNLPEDWWEEVDASMDEMYDQITRSDDAEYKRKELSRKTKKLVH